MIGNDHRTTDDPAEPFGSWPTDENDDQEEDDPWPDARLPQTRLEREAALERARTTRCLVCRQPIRYDLLPVAGLSYPTLVAVDLPSQERHCCQGRRSRSQTSDSSQGSGCG